MPDLMMIGASQHKPPPQTPRRKKNTPKPQKKKGRHRQKHQSLNADMNPLKRQPTPVFPPPPPINRTCHEHNIPPQGASLYQVRESNINKEYRREKPVAIYQELDDKHLNVRNWNHNVNQHIYDETLTPVEEDIDWDNDESGNEEDLPSKDQSSKQTHQDISVSDSHNPRFWMKDQVSLLIGPFTITERTGPDTYKLVDKDQLTVVVHSERLQLFTGSSDSINTPITTPSVTKNEL